MSISANGSSSRSSSISSSISSSSSNSNRIPTIDRNNTSSSNGNGVQYTYQYSGLGEHDDGHQSMEHYPGQHHFKYNYPAHDEGLCLCLGLGLGEDGNQNKYQEEDLNVKLNLIPTCATQNIMAIHNSTTTRTVTSSSPFNVTPLPAHGIFPTKTKTKTKTKTITKTKIKTKIKTRTKMERDSSSDSDSDNDNDSDVIIVESITKPKLELKLNPEWREKTKVARKRPVTNENHDDKHANIPLSTSIGNPTSTSTSTPAFTFTSTPTSTNVKKVEPKLKSHDDTSCNSDTTKIIRQQPRRSLTIPPPITINLLTSDDDDDDDIDIDIHDEIDIGIDDDIDTHDKYDYEEEKDSTENDSTDEWWEEQRRNRNQHKSTNGGAHKRRRSAPKLQPIRNDLLPLPFPSLAQGRRELQKIASCFQQQIPKPQDMSSSNAITGTLHQFLQVVLWDMNFRYVLLSHQHEAVLRVAGVNVVALVDVLKAMNLKQRLNILQWDGGDGDGVQLRREVCRGITFVETRGVLLADVMGLGKTVQGIGASVLRNGIFKLQYTDQVFSRSRRNNNNCIQNQKKNFRRDDKRTIKTPKRNLPTVIIGPNNAVLKQWEETLLLSGIEPTRIKYLHHNDTTLLGNSRERRWGQGHACDNEGDHYILMTRHQLMVSTKRLLQNKQGTNLFPSNRIPVDLLKLLHNQYKASKGKERNKYRERDQDQDRSRSSEADRITQLLCSNNRINRGRRPKKRRNEKGLASSSFLATDGIDHDDDDGQQPCFRMILIDEAHFLKNLVSFWGIGAALLGRLSERCVPLTGTPYNNGPQDMASLMNFIDVHHPAARKNWWVNATKDGGMETVIRNVRDWRSEYMIRREKDVLTCKLFKKTRTMIPVACHVPELMVYQGFESSFMDALSKFQRMTRNPINPLTKRHLAEMFTYLMCSMSNMVSCSN